MKAFSLFILFFLLFNCNSNSNTALDVRLHRIDFLNRNMKISVNYEKSSFSNIVELIKSEVDSGYYKDYEIQKLNRFKRLGAKAEIFIDKENFRNNITFHRENYFKMSKEALEIYTDMLENYLFIDSEENSFDFERIEGKFTDYGLADVIKVKYLQTFTDEENTKRYMTHYLVSHNLKSFGIVVLNTEDKDFEYILDTFKL